MSVHLTDAERDAVVRELTRHCGEGRITLEELEDRITEAYAAVTRASLRHALRELPPFRHDREPEPVDASAGEPVAGPRAGDRGGQAHRRCRRRGMARPPLFLIPLVIVISHLAR